MIASEASNIPNHMEDIQVLDLSRIPQRVSSIDLDCMLHISNLCEQVTDLLRRLS